MHRWDTTLMHCYTRLTPTDGRADVKLNEIRQSVAPTVKGTVWKRRLGSFWLTVCHHNHATPRTSLYKDEIICVVTEAACGHSEVPHLSRSCTCRRTWSSRSDPAGPWGAPAAGAAAAGQTGCWSEQGRMEWWSRRAENRRTTWACWPSCDRTDPWWRTRPLRTANRLGQKERRSLKHSGKWQYLHCDPLIHSQGFFSIFKSSTSSFVMRVHDFVCCYLVSNLQKEQNLHMGASSEMIKLLSAW